MYENKNKNPKTILEFMALFLIAPKKKLQQQHTLKVTS